MNILEGFFNLFRVDSRFGTLFTKFESASSSGDGPNELRDSSADICKVVSQFKENSQLLGHLLRKMQIQTS